MSDDGVGPAVDLGARGAALGDLLAERGHRHEQQLGGEAALAGARARRGGGHERADDRAAALAPGARLGRVAVGRRGVVEREPQRRLVALRVKERADGVAQAARGRTAGVAEDRVDGRAGRLPLVALQAKQDRVLVGEVLVERAHADAGLGGDADGGEALRALALENANSGLQDRGDQLGRTRLNRLFSSG